MCEAKWIAFASNGYLLGEGGDLVLVGAIRKRVVFFVMPKRIDQKQEQMTIYEEIIKAGERVLAPR